MPGETVAVTVAGLHAEIALLVSVNIGAPAVFVICACICSVKVSVHIMFTPDEVRVNGPEAVSVRPGVLIPVDAEAVLLMASMLRMSSAPTSMALRMDWSSSR
jgi:hypothetical protein